MKTVYFVDFDHTISKKDVWDAIARTSDPIQWRRLIDRYLSGELKSQDCNRLLAEMIRISEPEARRIVLSIGIDPTFHDFVRWADQQDTQLLIVSDGYDYYIHLLLDTENLSHLPSYCNHLKWNENGASVHFPLNRKDCEIGMAHCKCQHIEKQDPIRSVYIGDGMSDICASQKCSVVYAKRHLLRYFQEHQLPHHRFDNFLDIIKMEEEYFADQQALVRAT